jgi:hypothetical protein
MASRNSADRVYVANHCKVSRTVDTHYVYAVIGKCKVCPRSSYSPVLSATCDGDYRSQSRACQLVNVGLAEGAFVSICVWIADVTPVNIV